MPNKAKQEAKENAVRKTPTERAPSARSNLGDTIPRPQDAPPDPNAPELPNLEPQSPQAPETIPIRMLNEFTYCPRLFYYEFVEGVFVENADTLRGSAAHKRVDGGKGKLAPAQKNRTQKTDATEDLRRQHQKSSTPARFHWGRIR